MPRSRVKPVLHLMLAAVGLIVVLAAVLPHWSELGHVLTGRDKVDGTTGCLSGYDASADGTSCHAAAWVRVAEAGAIFVLLNGVVLGWVAYRMQRERSRRASAMRQDWLVARSQARLNAKAAAAHAATASWVAAPAPVSTVTSSTELVSQPRPPA